MTTIETTITSVIGPYLGKRISGTSDDVVEAIIAIVYNFDGFSIRITDIPTCVDQATGRNYLEGPVALRLNNKVNEIIEGVRQQWQDEPQSSHRDTPLRFELKAADFLTDAA